MLIRRPYVVLYISLALAVAISSLTAAVILQMRRDAMTLARDGGHNIVLLVERDLQQNLDAFASMLDTVGRASREASVLALPPEVRRSLLQDYVATTKGLGSLFVADNQGRVFYQFGKRLTLPASLAPGELLNSLTDTKRGELHLSAPFLPPVADARRSIALTHRVNDADGNPVGLVTATLELDYLREQFAGLSLGSGGEVGLYRLDGTPLLRWPQDDRRALGDMRFPLTGGGDFFETSAQDGVLRWHSFRRIGDYPLVFAIALPAHDIYRNWRWRAWTIGLLAAGLDIAIVSLALLAARQLRQRSALVSELREEAQTDALTGLHNRRAFDRRAAEEWSRAQRSGAPLALLMMDIDLFKAYNDHYGHPQGDQALRNVAQTIGGLVHRPGDFAARYGGEEFVVLLADSPLEQALQLGERIRATLQGRGLAHAKGPLGVLTISVGVASTSDYPAQSLEQLLEAADAALYRAKADGRNRVAAFDGDSPPSA